MSYAQAALRPAGPAVIKLDTTPVQRSASPKPASPAPAPVHHEEPPKIVEEEKFSTASLPELPQKAPGNVLSPNIRFVLRVPSISKELTGSSELVPEESSDSETDGAEHRDEEDGNANGTSANAKSNTISVQDLQGNYSKLSDLVAHLEKQAEERSFELEGGFRFSKSNKASGNGAKYVTELELDTVSQTLNWVSALIELLRSKPSTNIAAGGGSFISISRVDNHIRAIRVSKSKQNNSNNNNGVNVSKEVWLQFDDVVLEVREQIKLYLQVAERVAQSLERRESQLGDKERKEAAKKRRIAVTNKLHTTAFTSLLQTLQGLLSSPSNGFPELSKKYNEQEATLASQRRRVKDENAEMSNILFSFVPSNLAETDFNHIVSRLEPAVEEKQQASNKESSSEDKPQDDQTAASSSSQPAQNKRLSKKEAAAAAVAAAAAEAERKKAQEAEAEATRKAADAARKKKAEEHAALQASEKRKAIHHNPFSGLTGVTEDFMNQLEEQQEQAKEHQISKTNEAKTVQAEQRKIDEERRKQEQAAQQIKKKQQLQQSAMESAKLAQVENEKKAAKEAQQHQQAAKAKAQKENDAKKLAQIELERANAEKKKTDKAERARIAAEAEKAAKAAKAATQNAQQQHQSPSTSSVGPDRSEKQRKAEKIEADKLERERRKQMKELSKKSKSDPTTLYVAIGAGGIIALVVLYLLYTNLISPGQNL